MNLSYLAETTQGSSCPMVFCEIKAPSMRSSAQLIDPPSDINIDREGILKLSLEKPLLLVFLRQLGCCFSKEALVDLAKVQHRIEQSGGSLIIVHMSPAEEAEALFNSVGLTEVSHVSDPGATLFDEFGVGRARWSQLLNPLTLARAVWAGIMKGHGFGYAGGDALRMPGTFVLKDRKILSAQLPSNLGQRVNFIDLYLNALSE